MEYEKINYYKQPLTPEKLKSLIKKLGIPAKDLLRSKEPIYRELNLDKKADQMPDDELIQLMIQHPDLMQRPIIEKGDKAVIARPIEKLNELLQ